MAEMIRSITVTIEIDTNKRAWTRVLEADSFDEIHNWIDEVRQEWIDD